ncbi:hypothetical protein D3C79_1091710 [compost metagenome]
MTSGVTPMRNRPKMKIGKVVVPAWETIIEITKLSSDTMKASISPEKIPGISSGRVTLRKVRHGPA